MRSILAANRSEIAIRIFRAANEIGLRTIAIYSQEDRLSLHRFKADEAYQIGVGKGPVEAYLDIAGIVALARERKVDAIHPGYGFLSENPEFASACEAAGITFIGPTPEFLRLLGDKTAARGVAAAAGVPVLPGTDEPVKSAGRGAPSRLADRISPDHQGCDGRRRARNARGSRRFAARRPARGSAKRSEKRIRRRFYFSRKISAARPAHRSSDHCRYSRQRAASVGTRLFRSAPPSKSGRSRACRKFVARRAAGVMRRRRANCQGGGLPECRHGGIPARCRFAAVVFHRSESANPG